SPMLNEWLDAVVPAPAMFNFLPKWTPPNIMEQLATKLMVTINKIKAFQNGQDLGNIKQWLKVIQQINQLVDSFPTLPFDKLAQAVQQYDVLIKKLDNLLKKIDADRLKVMKPLLQALRDDVFNTAMNCTRIDDLWDKLDPGYNVQQPGVFYPPE